MNSARKTLAVAAALLLLLAACGTADGDAIEVVATDFSFEPTSISVDQGEEVTIELDNQGDAEHSFTAEDLGIDVEAEGGSTAEGSFTAPETDGTFEFVCKFHPDQMRGEVVVGAGGGGTGGRGGGEDAEDDESSEFDRVTPGETPPEGTTEGEDEFDDGY